MSAVPADPRTAAAPGDVAVLRGLVRAGPTAFAFVLLAGALALVPGLAIPLLIRTFLDQYLIAAATEWALPIVVGLAAAAAALGLLSWVQYRVLSRFAVRLGATGATEFVWHALRIPAPALDALGAGDVTARGAATQRLAFQAGLLLPLAFVNVLTVLVFSAVLLLLDLRLGLFALLVVLVSMLASVRMLRTRAARQEAADASRVRRASLTSEIVASIETVKAQAAEQWIFDRWSRSRDDAARAVSDLGTSGQRLGVIGPLTPSLGLGVMLAVGSAMVLAGQLSLGTLVASQGLLLQVLVPAGQLVWLGVLLTAVTSIERQAALVREIPLDLEVRPVVRTDGAPLPGLADWPVSVGLRDVVFGYDRDAPPLFDRMDLEIPAGSRVALVGGSGSGKSTLVRLVIGELQPWSGTVALDGVPRLDIPRHLRTGAVAYVPQSPVIVPGTIRENVTLFDRRIPAADVAAAIRDARIEDAIGARPHGLDEEVTSSGHGFSGGELQRLAIARALCRRPRLLVLDEATSALDPIVEAEVEGRLRERACTTLVVAHRISTVRDAETIVVIDAGRIVQRGRYDELRTVGRFAELING